MSVHLEESIIDEHYTDATSDRMAIPHPNFEYEEPQRFLNMIPRRHSQKHGHQSPHKWAPRYEDDFNIQLVKASSVDLEGATNKKALLEQVWRLSFPPKDLETKQTITAKMFLDCQALVRLKMSRTPCATGPIPTNVPSASGAARPPKYQNS